MTDKPRVLVLNVLLLLYVTTGGAARLPAASAIPAAESAIVHLLNRAAFGPRPGDVDRVEAIGIEQWIDSQLDPSRVDDSRVEERLRQLPTVGLSARQLAEQYLVPAMRERQREQRQRTMREGNDDANAERSFDAAPTRDDPTPERRKERQAIVELAEQKLVRAVLSERQLQEVLVDFWFNHFNVSITKGPTRLYVLEYERDVIRPHVLGRFRELLGATAHSPAMLFYLDNWLSSAPAGATRTDDAPRVRRRGATIAAMRPANARSRGLNENYARELMELHTLGVDGGYTQQDVTEVARAFTGWTIDRPREGGGFVFRPALHDEGAKTVLGVRLPAGGGQRDGERVLDILSRHPATARFIATKLARRFVGDTPPAALIDRMTSTFRATDGDLRAVVRSMLLAPEFYEDDVRREKVKTPLEFAVSAVRAVGSPLLDAAPLAKAIRDLGMPLYAAQPPTGYSDANDAWMTAGALVNRMNFAIALANRGARVAQGRSGASAPEANAGNSAERVAPADDLIDALIHGPVSPATRTTIARATTTEMMIALVLGSPEFQRR